MDILHISQSTKNRNLSMNFKFVTTYLKFYTKRPVYTFINLINVNKVPMFILATMNEIFLTSVAVVFC